MTPIYSLLSRADIISPDAISQKYILERMRSFAEGRHAPLLYLLTTAVIMPLLLMLLLLPALHGAHAILYTYYATCEPPSRFLAWQVPLLPPPCHGLRRKKVTPDIYI